jgi:hypothetical protein
MKKSDVFPSKYVKVADLNGGDVEATISSVEWEKVGDDEKAVCYFKGNKVKPLPLNKTNYESIQDIDGDEETDNWGGTIVVLYPTTVRFNGVQTPCIRIKEQRVAVPAQTSLDGVEATF